MYPSGFMLEQRFGELFGGEGLEILGLFAEADELDGDAELTLDGDDHSAFAGAVEFGQHEASERDGLVELARLNESVHARGGIEHEQDLVRSAGQLPAHDAVKLLKLLHQIVFGVEAAG